MTNVGGEMTLFVNIFFTEILTEYKKSCHLVMNSKHRCCKKFSCSKFALLRLCQIVPVLLHLWRAFLLRMGVTFSYKTILSSFLLFVCSRQTLSKSTKPCHAFKASKILKELIVSLHCEKHFWQIKGCYLFNKTILSSFLRLHSL